MNLAESRSHVPLVNFPKPKKKPKPIRKVAKKRVKLNSEYSKLRKNFLNSHPFCQWFILELGHSWEYAMGEFNYLRDSGIYPESTEIHHRKGRGKFLLDTSTWMAVGPEGHRRIHATPEESYAKSYMLPRR